MHVDYLIPGLFELPLEELDRDFLCQRLPHINRLLGLASLRPNHAYTIDAMWLNALGHQASAEAGRLAPGLPMAHAFAPGQPGSRQMLFQAIHLKPDMHSALILPIENTEENRNDISIIINDLTGYFKVDCDIKLIDGETYLMDLRGFDVPLHYPHLLSVLGKSANPYIEQSRAIMPWYQLLNEMQMYLHQHPLNAERVNNGSLAINSLWCWGAGPLQQPARRPHCYCDDFLFRGFASSLGLQASKLSQLDLKTEGIDVLVMNLRLLQALKSMQQQPLSELLLDMDETLFKPLMARLDRGLSSFQLCAGFTSDLALNRFSRYRFWRKAKSIREWMTQQHDY